MSEELAEALSNLYAKLSEAKPLESEFQKVLDDNFWDLLITNDDIKKGDRPSWESQR